MTKKKMVALIIIGVVVLFSCSTVINYFSALEMTLDNLQGFWNSMYTIEDDINNFISDINDVSRRITFSSPVYGTFSKPSFAFAMLDRNGEVVFKSESGIWWKGYDEENFNYLSLEPFLRDDLRKEILKFQKESDDRFLIMRELKVHFNGEEYFPVSFVLDNQRKELRTFILSDFEPTQTIRESKAYLYYSLYDFDKIGIDHKYFLKSQEKLQNKIENFVFKTNDYGGGGGFFGGGAMDYESVGDDYAFFYFVDYSEFYKTVSSNEFFSMTFYMTIMFFIAGSIIIIVACKLYNKNQNMNSAKRAFTSAAAHELKTPLTVIQNRCECVMENIAPDKNGEYIKSIYDEALRMNGIVQSLLTFNRLSDATKISKEKVDLSCIVKAEFKKYSDFAEGFGVSLSSDIEENIFIQANAEMISIAVDNYLSNAVKYSAGDKEVKVVLKKDGKEFKFSVFNDSEKDIYINSSVWDVLSRNDAARNSKDNSSGMGLPICKHIFRLHGYKHWFDIKFGRVGFYFSGKTE